MYLQPLAEKRGFGLTGGFWNRFGITLIKAPVDVITSALSDYFRTDCDIDLRSSSLNQSKKSFLWQYIGHEWTVWWSFAREEIAFVLALFLETKAIVITHQGTSDWTTFKMFDRDKLVEYYLFGFDERDLEKKFGHLHYENNGYWDLEIVQTINYPRSLFPFWYRHMFCSSIRQVTENEMRASFTTQSNEFSFLDVSLRYHEAYLPDCKETPLSYYHSVLECQSLLGKIIRLDAVVLPKEAFYEKNLLTVPNRVK